MRKHPILGGAAVLIVLIAIVAGASGKGSGSGSGQGSGGSTDTATTSAVAPAQAPAEAAPLRSTTPCGAETRVASHTSCQFAAQVLKAYATETANESGTPSATVTAWSPVTRTHYTMTCSSRSISAETVMVCTGGQAAYVTFPVAAVEQSRHSATESHERTEESSPPAQETNQPKEESGGEDTVGSPSHAGDQQFCEEQECIGNFTEEEGTVVECVDGSYSHAGGNSGACSDHGGVGRE